MCVCVCDEGTVGVEEADRVYAATHLWCGSDFEIRLLYTYGSPSDLGIRMDKLL